MKAPRVAIAGLNGGGGKTLVAVGLVAAWRERGRAVAPFKKGPDYIDAAWLTHAAARPCRNLDLFLMAPETVRRSVGECLTEAEVAVIEGNRGLFDGADARGTYSTAELAKLLSTPVVLVVDCTKCTRTAAAIVLGCQRLDPDIAYAGVILNRTAGARHESVLRQAIEETSGIPILGAIPRLDRHPFPERHLGLVPPPEHQQIGDAVALAAQVAEQHLDLDAIWRAANAAPPLDARVLEVARRDAPRRATVRIGVFRDAAFQFYYPENLEAVMRAGARVVEISPLHDTALPNVDALYVGGGFPETLAQALADNEVFRVAVRRAVDDGLPVYAECGGAVYLGETLEFGGRIYPMVGALPAAFAFQSKPQGHGYAVLEATATNPFFPVGELVRGHEFHYTYVRALSENTLTYAFRVRRGHGIDGEHDGLCTRNVVAAYTHVHALGTPTWGPALVAAARRHRAATRRASRVAG